MYYYSIPTSNVSLYFDVVVELIASHDVLRAASAVDDVTTSVTSQGASSGEQQLASQQIQQQLEVLQRRVRNASDVISDTPRRRKPELSRSVSGRSK